MNSGVISKEELDNLMEMFVKFDTLEKKNQIINLLKLMITMNAKMCNVYNSEFNMLYNKEISDISADKNSAEDDFLEATYVFLLLLQSSNTQIIEALIKEQMDTQQ